MTMNSSLGRAANGNHHQIRVLLVDDHAVIRQGLKMLLESRPEIEVVADCENGREALLAVERLKPDVVLMDVVMPGLNGYQATRTLTRDDATKHIPIIVCTSKGQETDRIWGLRQGALDYIVKPVNGEDLLAKIASL